MNAMQAHHLLFVNKLSCDKCNKFILIMPSNLLWVLSANANLIQYFSCFWAYTICAIFSYEHLFWPFWDGELVYLFAFSEFICVLMISLNTNFANFGSNARKFIHLKFLHPPKLKKRNTKIFLIAIIFCVCLTASQLIWICLLHVMPC